MIWPIGPPKVLKSAKSFTGEAEDENFTSICVSRHSFYAALCSATCIALYRLKPLVPCYIYRNEQENYTKIRASHTGSYLVAQSRNKFCFFAVLPEGELDEILRPTTQFTQTYGPGEALGVRELHLKHVNDIELDNVIDIFPFQEYLILLTQDKLYFSPWEKPELTPVSISSFISDKIVSGSHSTLLSRLCLVTATDDTYIIHMKHDTFTPFPVPVSSKPLGTCFNLRFAKLCVVFKGSITCFNVKDMDENPCEFEVPEMEEVTALEWSPSGTALLVGHTGGWFVVSVLGSLLHVEQVPVSKVEWSVGGDEIFLLQADHKTLFVYETLRMFQQQSFAHPVIFGGQRLFIYHDNHKQVLPASPWLTLPAPTQYLGYNWPIMSVATNSDGKLIAIAGSYGLMYISIADRQWKTFSDRDCMVKSNGLLWYKKYLILSLAEHPPKVQVFSTALSAANTITTEEEQCVASIDLLSPVVTMTVREMDDELGLLLHSGKFQRYKLKNGSPVLLEELSLVTVLTAPGRVRTMTLVDAERTLFLVDDRLILVKIENREDKIVSRKLLATPLEYYHLYDSSHLWVCSGTEMTLLSLHDDESEEKFQTSIEFYPVGISMEKGLFVTVDTVERKSYDRSFTYIEPSMDVQVFLPWLFEQTISRDMNEARELARDYHHLDYFEDVMESALYRSLMDDKALDATMVLIKEFTDWPKVVVRCARKIEMKFWARLFKSSGSTPKSLFDLCLQEGKLEVAAEYLLVLQTEDTAELVDDNTIKLFNLALAADQYDICKQICNFLKAADDSQGGALKKLATAAGI